MFHCLVLFSEDLFMSEWIYSLSKIALYVNYVKITSPYATSYLHL